MLEAFVTLCVHGLWASVAVYAIQRVMAHPRLLMDTQTPAADAAPVIPDDLLALAMQENELWAQEEVLRVIRERYEILHDWNKVRSAMNIGAMST